MPERITTPASEIQDALKDIVPKIDDDLINHVVNVYDIFRTKLNKKPSCDIITRDKIAGYLTLAYFLTGGKMPYQKFYQDDEIELMMMLEKEVGKPNGPAKEGDGEKKVSPENGC